MQRAMSATESIRPASVPMSMDVGRLTARDAASLLGLAVGALAVGAVGALLGWLALPLAAWDWSGWRVVFVSFGLAVGVLGVGLAAITARFAVRDWTSYHERLSDYHQLVLESHEQSGGVEVERTITGWELLPDRPLHVLGLALSVHEAVAAGRPSPFSVRSLVGDRWLGDTKLGILTPAAAEQASKLLSDMALVTGRKERQAGRWAAENVDDVIRLVSRHWARRGAAGLFEE